MGLYGFSVEPVANSRFGQYFRLCTPSSAVFILLFAITVFVVLLAVILYQRGGAIQKIVDTKTGVTDIRAATIIDFMYALILLVFKEWSNIPMSTTWVFLGLLAGREFAMSMILMK